MNAPSSFDPRSRLATALLPTTLSEATPLPPVDFKSVLTPMLLSQAAFVRDLSTLLFDHPGEWVAYADGARVRFGRTQAELYHHCLAELGLTHDRFVVRRVVPETERHVEYNLR